MDNRFSPPEDLLKMARRVTELEKEIRALSLGEQEQLLRALVEELDGPLDPNAEQAWLEEVLRRSRELDEGTVAAVPANDVFREARADLKR
jgi:putative addiction module component (TIGR02574 family)